MGDRKRRVSPRTADKTLLVTLPEIALNHGRALWVLQQLGFRGETSASTFYEYIKSLRKLGTPFRPGEIGLARRARANYSYYHVMELALALTLRVYHVVPDSVLRQIIRYRRSLYRHFRRAYTERCSGLGTQLKIHADASVTFALSGVFLDLQINFSGGRLVSFGPPRILSPADALRTFAASDLATRAFLPINLSQLSERVVGLALIAPLPSRWSI
jgi:hypothetical protein